MGWSLGTSHRKVLGESEQELRFLWTFLMGHRQPWDLVCEYIELG